MVRAALRLMQPPSNVRSRGCNPLTISAPQPSHKCGNVTRLRERHVVMCIEKTCILRRTTRKPYRRRRLLRELPGLAAGFAAARRSAAQKTRPLAFRFGALIGRRVMAAATRVPCFTRRRWPRPQRHRRSVYTLECAGRTPPPWGRGEWTTQWPGRTVEH
ncbi:hypothetical protein MTO96_031597 [Rhipicephalus appendiculatus]